ncbi:ATP-binding protein [Hymenobacter sp. BT188]|uniref:sacsin N-terminal ATP-binding-like domain-containing protein n=1 Tax=Hymenobacter sp. BT188 TaxID=2763504 RepID=UPI0016512C31|nr:DUF3883 domain-containing protein [Hymenobacter sp. BT188]MBC6606938.1 ATP-binding protein [Hymenobacter sp. BT188]
MPLTQLVNDCKALRDALRKRNSDLSTVLSELYSEKAHFIYELLQNAEDAEATWIKLYLLPTALVIKHNGRAFDVHDIDAITGISNTDNEKKANQDKIGRFGIGFKSVFKITSRPRIQSGNFDFEIEDYIVPIITSVNAEYDHTIITLPFAGGEEAIGSTYQAIETKLQTLEGFNLLFLRNLGEIQMSWGAEHRIISKRGHVGFDTALASIQSLEEVVNDNDIIKQRYLFFQAPVQHTDFQQLRAPQRLALAFRLSEQEGPTKLVPAENSFAFVFFETTHKTSLHFLVHAPFVTTPSRENLKVGLAVNNSLMDELGALLQQTLPYFKKHNLLTVGTLNLLPLARPDKEYNRSPIYTKLFQALKESLSSQEAFLPIVNERYHQPATQLLLAGSRELTSLLDARKQLEFLWPGHSHWLPPIITADATPTLYTYLKQELQIPEISAAAAVQLFTPTFLSAQTAAWMRKLYGFLGTARQVGLWQKSTSGGNARSAGFLRYQPFMRLRGNAYSAPFDADDKAQVFLPFEDGVLEQRANCLDFATIDSKPARNFVTQLGIKKPDLLDEIRLNILPLYSRNDGFTPNKKSALRHFRLIAAAYALGSEKRRELVEMVQDSDVRFVRALTQPGKKVVFCSFQEAYLPDESLHSYLQHSKGISLVDADFYKNSGVKEWDNLLKGFGFKYDHPWVVQFDPRFSEAHKQSLQGIHSTRSTSTLDYKLEGFDEMLNVSPFTPELSFLTWEILLKAVSQIKSLNALNGRHSWFYGTDRLTSFPSHLRRLLENTPWLYVVGPDGEGQWQPVTEVIFESLPATYARESEASLYLLQNLNWKTTARAHLEQQMLPDEKARWDAYKQAVADGIDIEAAIQAQRAKQQSQREQEKKRLEQAPALDVDNFMERPFEPTITTPAEIGERQKGIHDGSAAESSSSTLSAKPGPTLRKGIGERGEEVVWKQLQKEYNVDASFTRLENTSTYVRYFNITEGIHYELIHGNTEKTISEGCDFIVKRNNEIIRYIEVKATSEIKKTVFEVSERQWRVAFTLWQKQKGEQYEIWFIHAALTAKPTYTPIKDPVVRWRNGDLGAAPVRIEV